MQVEPSKAGWKVLRDLLVHIEHIATILGFEVEWQINLRKGTDMVEIEVREGETMVDALTRVAKERAKSEIMDGTASVAEKTNQKAGKKASSRSPKRKPAAAKRVTAQDMGGDPLADKVGSREDRDTVFRAIHVYKRPGETDQKARHNAHREREMSGPSTLVFSHLHPFGDSCSGTCLVKVTEEEEA